VFVGLLNHMAPRERQVPFEMEKASVRFYIKISTKDLLRQYYTRVLKYADANPRFWTEVVDGKDRIDSSDEKKQENRDLAAKHKAARYMHVRQDDILEYFAEQLFPASTTTREHTPIHFADSGYFYGTKYSINVTEGKDGKFHAVYDGQNIGHKDIEFATDAIWQVADDYVADGTFHKEVAGVDSPTRCADCGYALVYYRGLVAKPEAVGRLVGMVTQWFGALPP
jgi:hypothetical protein